MKARLAPYLPLLIAIIAGAWMLRTVPPQFSWITFALLGVGYIISWVVLSWQSVKKAAQPERTKTLPGPSFAAIADEPMGCGHPHRCLISSHVHLHNGILAGYPLSACSVCPSTDPRRNRPQCLACLAALEMEERCIDVIRKDEKDSESEDWDEALAERLHETILETEIRNIPLSDSQWAEHEREQAEREYNKTNGKH